MQRTQIAALKLVSRLLDVVVVTVTYLAVMRARILVRRYWTLDLIPSDEPILRPLAETLHLELLVVVVPIWLFCLHHYKTYDDYRHTRTDLLFFRIARAVGMATLGLMSALFLLQLAGDVSRTMLAGFALTSMATLFLARRAMVGVWRRLHRQGLATHDIVVVGRTHEVLPLLETLERNAEWGIRILGVVLPEEEETDPGEVNGRHIPVWGRVHELPQILEQHTVNQVLLTGRTWDTRTLHWIADSCEELGVEFSMDANFLGLRVARAELTDFEGWSVLSFSATPTNGEAMVIKRSMDVILGGLALFLLSPILLLTALAIKLEDPAGPVLYGQERSGLFGKTFTMWKFRSMVTNADALRETLLAENEMDGPVFKIKNDPRITRVGRLIRKTSIDEFPQFWNVFVGQMSLVGPRPPIPAEVTEYKRWQMRRLSMKPGITCIWQVEGRNNVDFETWMKLDLQYIDNWSLFLDFKLMVRTLPAVLFGTGAS
jgi:exopolysaccharide biosynthesis polyprenyl glycosylphosphotransferase